MTIDINTIATLLGGALFTLVGFLLKKQLVDRADRLEQKIDELTDTVHQMALKNERDHGEVTRQIDHLKSKVDALHDNS